MAIKKVKIYLHANTTSRIRQLDAFQYLIFLNIKIIQEMHPCII